MASSVGYLDYVLDLLADVPEVAYRKMMGEYLLYAQGKLFGGIYDDRFLVKDTFASRAVRFQSSRIASQSAIRLSGVSEGRCFHPRKSLPAPFPATRTSKASRALPTYALYLASSTKPQQPFTSTLTISLFL